MLISLRVRAADIVWVDVVWKILVELGLPEVLATIPVLRELKFMPLHTLLILFLD